MRRLLPFAPFLVVALAHLVTLLVGNEQLSTATKFALMPALLVSLLWSVLSVLRASLRIVILTTLGIAFSWVGDVLISSPDGNGFLLGLGSFAVAHIAYLVLFITSVCERRVPLAVIVFAAWWVVIVLVLAPHVGTLLVPIAIYGLLIVALAAISFCANRFVVGGAVTFLISDTLLALKFFVPGWDFYPIDFIIMAFYLVGQGFIAYGAGHRALTLSASRRP